MTITFSTGDSSECALAEVEKSRSRVGHRNKIYSRSVILPRVSRNFTKRPPEDMSRVPLISPERGMIGADNRNMVMLEAGLPGDTWRYCVERERLAGRSEWFRALLMGPLAPEPSDPPPLVKLQYVDKRAFDCFLKYLHDETINFQSVSTARATLDAAHQYLCPELALLAVRYLEANLKPSTVLEIYQGLGLYCNYLGSVVLRSPTSPSAPPVPGDDAGEIAAVCTRLFDGCLSVIDTNPEAVFRQERFEELTVNEVADLTRRDSLRLTKEIVLFSALERWAASACKRRGIEPTPSHKREALPDDIWYSVRYLLMTDREFIEGPMASGILSIEESAFIVQRILGHHQNREQELEGAYATRLTSLSNAPRITARAPSSEDCRMLKPGKKERQDNRKNRRKECASQGQRTCARIGNCLVRVLACVFD